MGACYTLFVPTVTFKPFQIWTQISTFWNFYATNGDILVSACPYLCIHVRDIVLKLHVWIPHGKIADAYFWFSLNYPPPLLNYGPLTNKGMKFCKCRILNFSIIARNLKLVSADRG